MKNYKRLIQAAILLSLVAGAASNAAAQVTISAGFAVSNMEVKYGTETIKGKIGYGGNIYLDYLLPIGVPLSIGVEAGYDTATATYETGYAGYDVEITGVAIPILFRAAYHFDLASKLDLYLVGKVGYVIGSAEYSNEKHDGYGGIGFGFDAGVAWYFASKFGIFVEGGFDKYNIKKTENNFTIEAPFSRFVTVGISTKF